MGTNRIYEGILITLIVVGAAVTLFAGFFAWFGFTMAELLGAGDFGALQQMGAVIFGLIAIGAFVGTVVLVIVVIRTRRKKSKQNRTEGELRRVMPSDLTQALSGDEDAWKNFQRFANSYGNAYIDWVNNAETDEMRRKRIVEVVERSFKNRKPGVEQL